MSDIEELKKKLESDKQELQELELLLEEDPQNEELHTLKQELINVIKVASDQIVNLQKQQQLQQPNIISPPNTVTSSIPTTISSSSSSSSSTLPQQITNNNNHFNTKESSTLAVGTRCEGKYSVDGIWYPGVITELKGDGTYLILYDGYGNSEALTFENIRPLSRVKLGSGVKDQSTRFASASDGFTSIPHHYRINPDDSEETKKKKLKKQQQIKSSNRVHRLDEENRQQKQKWQDFLNETKKTGRTLTDRGLKKGSIFSTPDNLNGKVGVVNSGKGMTESSQFSLKKKSINNP